MGRVLGGWRLRNIKNVGSRGGENGEGPKRGSQERVPREGLKTMGTGIDESLREFERDLHDLLMPVVQQEKAKRGETQTIFPSINVYDTEAKPDAML
jgi:hypothetical protein